LKAIEELQKKLEKVSRIRLVNLPTPLEEMPRLTKILKGPRLWIKRDDCTGMAFGGNKERKTEFVMADALNKKADVVITTGAIQSNHVRATAVAARKLGLEAVLVLHGTEPVEYDGNLLLDQLLGAKIRFISEENVSLKSDPMDAIAKQLKKEGHVPYVIPSGASYPLGAVSYVNAMLEILAQAEDRKLEIDCVVHAAGSGGTQAGLVLANKTLKSRIAIKGICVEPDGTWLSKKTVDIANGTAKLLNLKVTVRLADVILIEEYSGKEYGTITREIAETIRLMARTEGIILDPVYTGKAMAGLIDMIRNDHFKKDDNVIFIHTGGTPALFAYRKELA
jgi:L-cysteate sulfo-lyase